MEEMFRRAESADLGPVCALIDSRIAWMKAAGLRQWDAEDYRRWYSDDYFRSAAANGELFVLCGADGSLHAAACLRETDRHWDDGVPALYVNNLAASAQHKGAGSEFLRRAASLAAAQGMERLRLDCNSGCEKLNRWYEAQGFRAVGTMREGVYRGVLREKLDLPGRPLSVNVLLFDGFETLDAFGPVDILHRIGDWRLRYISARGGDVRSAQNFFVRTEAADEADTAGALLLPGGMGTRALVNDAAFLALLKRLAENATYCLSVCTGSALLAACGVLDGRRATSNKRAFAWAASCGERVLWQPKARWTVDGKFCTSSGVSAGMDMALGFVADRFGGEKADEIARTIEYVRNSNPDCDPFAVEDPA